MTSISRCFYLIYNIYITRNFSLSNNFPVVSFVYNIAKIRLIILRENMQLFPQAYQRCITINNEGEICSYNICLGSHAVDLLPIYYLKSFLLHKQFSQTSVLSIDLVLMQLFVENVGY